MSGECSDDPSGNNRARMQGQYAALMTQSTPYRPKKIDLNILWCSPGGRTEANLPATLNFEVPEVPYPDKNAVGCVGPFLNIRYRRMSRSDLDKDVDTLTTGRRSWHAGER